MSNVRQVNERFRLASTESNALNEKAALKEEQNGAWVEKKTLKLDNGKQIRYFHIKKNFSSDNKETNKEIYLFDVTKDSQSKLNNPSLVYCGDVIKKIFELHAMRSNLTILMPTLQCRGFFKLPLLNGWFKKMIQKSHIVLMEMRFNDKKLVIHDPQRNFNLLLRKIASLLHMELYPDKFLQIIKELKQKGYCFSYETQFYNKQNDSISCGVFNHQYILSYLKHGDADHFKAITVQYGNQPSQIDQAANTIYLGEDGKEDYLAKFLNDWSTTQVLKTIQNPIWSANSFDEFDLEALEQFELIDEPSSVEKIDESSTVEKSDADHEIDLIVNSFVEIGDQGLFASPKINHDVSKPHLNLPEVMISNYKP